MIKSGTKLKIADNAGGLIANCIEVKKGSFGKAGSVLRISLRKVTTTSSLKKGSMHLAVVVRVKAKHLRKDGSSIFFNENACVLINDSGEPKGTSVSGSIMKEVKQKGYIKISQQADEVI